MNNETKKQDNRLSTLFIGAVSAAGLTVFAGAAYSVATSPIEMEWLLLSVVAIAVVSRTDLKIPRISSTVTLSNTFIFIALMLYGIPAAVVLAGVDAFVCSLHYSNKRRVVPFNVGLMSLSVFLSGSLAVLAFGDLGPAVTSAGGLLAVGGFLAVVHYILNSMMVTGVEALRRGRNVIEIWRDAFSWAWVANLAEAAAACLAVKLAAVVSIYGIIVAVPIVAVTYQTYRHYTEKVANSIRHAEHVAEMYLNTIKAMATAIDAKDEVSHGRVQRVQVYAMALGRLFKLSTPEMAALKAGSLLYDIGKLAVPDHILNKPSPLSVAEFEKFKAHTIVGAEMLEQVEFPYPIVPLVRHHHERWDGLGYPDGLSGEQIPLAARIIAVADVFVSACEDHGPHRAHARERAIELLSEGSGTLFDPAVVSIFLQHLSEFDSEINMLDACVTAPDGNPGAQVKTLDSGRLAFDKIRRAHYEGMTLYQMAQMLGTSLDIGDTFAALCSKLDDMVGYTSCVLYLQQDDSIELEAAIAKGCNADQFTGRRMASGAGIAGWVAAARLPMYNCDPRRDFVELGLEFDEEYLTAAVVPLMKGDEALGALALYSAELPAYDAEHIRLTEALSNMSVDAIANALDHERAELRSLRDQLTGLPNARGFVRHFEKAADRARRFGESFAVLVMDLDGFKQINDHLGHQAGDDVLRHMACALSKLVRSDDFLCRYGGDEFVAVIRVSPGEVGSLVERVQASVDEHDFGLADPDLSVGVSVGWSVFGVDGEERDDLFHVADCAMYADKTRRKAMPLLSGNQPDSGPHRIM
ncbi:MAG TPA: diguanylate cyclase [Blastocatellia bacterium]|nr:diguanylate cyclase [Blastocatellia bacterium]